MQSARALRERQRTTHKTREWALDFAPELKMIDAALKMAGIDTCDSGSRRTTIRGQDAN
jgi:hypothetical protein